MSNSYPHAKIQTSAWQCQCQCLAVQCTLQSSSQGISKCFPRHSQFSVRYKNTFARHLLFRGFYLLSCGRVLYRTIFTVDANNNVHTYDCMRIALSLRVHHRAQRLFTIPLRGSAINTEQLCQSIRDSKISPCAVQYAPIARLALVSAPIIGVAVQYAPIARLAHSVDTFF